MYCPRRRFVYYLHIVAEMSTKVNRKMLQNMMNHSPVTNVITFAGIQILT